MARIATLLGKDVKSGDWSSLGAGTGDVIGDLISLRNKIADNAGILKKGKSELKFSELRLLATGTAGGELKARRKFK